MEQINSVAEKSKSLATPKKTVKSSGIIQELAKMSEKVLEYFSDSDSILIENAAQLHDYVTKMIEAGIGGIDTETTGLDVNNDTIVGASLYYPGGVDCYIPINHLVPIFDTKYLNQLTYEQVKVEFDRFLDSGTKLIFANADFDLAMIHKDIGIDLSDVTYFDVLVAWRCIKEDELKNGLKELYCKYVLKGEGDPMKFNDFFTPTMFPYCKPEIAKLYAAHDAKITYELYTFELPYLTKGSEICTEGQYEHIADLVWSVEFPMIKVCHSLHARGIYLDKAVAEKIHDKYLPIQQAESEKLAKMVDEILQDPKYIGNTKKQPVFRTGAQFNPKSPKAVSYLLYDVMKLNSNSSKKGTGKDDILPFNLPVTSQIVKCRSLGVILSTFVEKLPNATAADGRIHCKFHQIGADTGRLSSSEPNMQNIPSKMKDIRTMFRASPEYIDWVPCTTANDKSEVYVAEWDSIAVRFEATTSEYTQVKNIPTGDNNVLCECKVGKDIQMIPILSISEERDEYSRRKITLSSPVTSIRVQHIACVMMSSDYSQQEPRITAYVSQDEKMIKSFQENKDIYATIASIAFGVPYEECLENTPEGEYSADGAKRRTSAKSIVLGICYGRSVVTIAEQLFGSDKKLSDDEKVKQAQNVYDSVLLAFPALRTLMIGAQRCAAEKGYVETILGRRRHIPDMGLPRFQFAPMDGYSNPDIDPLDVSTLDNEYGIPPRIVDALTKELNSYKYFGQVVKRTRELADEHIKVINNSRKISDAERLCVNSIIQGSAADQSKMAMLLVENDPEWKSLGGKVIIPVHDELIAEVPICNWEPAAKRLSFLMCEAANFLPFQSKCDVTVTHRWYGLEYPCPYPKPTKLSSDLTPEEVKWVQYQLCECGYVLPVPKDTKLHGDAVHGVNGIVSPEYESYILEYCNRYNILQDKFIEHIEYKVTRGVILRY